MSCSPSFRSFFRKGGDLSGGQQQQLAIGRALLGQPSCFSMNQPRAFNPTLFRTSKRLCDGSFLIGVLACLVEQHLNFVRQADRYYAMQRGGIVASGPTTELSQTVVDAFLSV